MKKVCAEVGNISEKGEGDKKGGKPKPAAPVWIWCLFVECFISLPLKQL